MVAKKTETGSITVSLNASTPDELASMIAALARTFGGYDKLAERVANVESNTQPLTGVSTAVLDVTTPIPPEQVQQSEIPSASPSPVPQQNVVKDNADLSKLRDEAIQKLTEYFGKNPQTINDLAAMQKKFGVRLFKDIPDDRVQEFAQDAHMLINGTTEG